MVLTLPVAKEVAIGIIAVTALLRRRHRMGSGLPQEALSCIIAGVVDYCMLSRNPDSGYVLFRTNFVAMACHQTIAAVGHNLPWLFHIAIANVIEAFHLGCNWIVQPRIHLYCAV